jgi:DoxX-like family
MEATIPPAHPIASSPSATATAVVTTDAAPALSARTRWGGRILSGIPALFLLADGLGKLVAPPPVTESFLRLGMSPSLATAIGVLQLACLAVYLFPRTAAVGAVLLTGYLGGAISLHVRLGDPLLTHTLFPCYLGALLWAGLFLRDPRLPALFRDR